MARFSISEALFYRLKQIPGEIGGGFKELGVLGSILVLGCAVMPFVWAGDRIKKVLR